MHSQTCHSAEQRLPITQYQTLGQKPQGPPQAHCSLRTKPSQARYAIYELQNLRLTRAFPHLEIQHPNPFNNRLHLRLFLPHQSFKTQQFSPTPKSSVKNSSDQCRGRRAADAGKVARSLGSCCKTIYKASSIMLG